VYEYHTLWSKVYPHSKGIGGSESTRPRSRDSITKVKRVNDVPSPNIHLFHALVDRLANMPPFRNNGSGRGGGRGQGSFRGRGGSRGGRGGGGYGGPKLPSTLLAEVDEGKGEQNLA
jgi:hypothetical protein